MLIVSDVINLWLLTLHVIVVTSVLVMLKRVKEFVLVTVLHSHSTLITVSSVKAAGSGHFIKTGIFYTGMKDIYVES